MHERHVREQQQHGEAACRTERSPWFGVYDGLATTIPGVRPPVQAFLQRRAPPNIRRARGLVADVARTEREPSTLSDASYVRLGIAPGGRLQSHKVLLSVLRSRPAPSDVR
jgi:hypothetical protein